MKNKGIILAGGLGKRLLPLTKSISKHLLPVYKKPMIFYPLSYLIYMGITEILIIVKQSDLKQFQLLLDNGAKLGVNIHYKIQDNPNGIAEAFIIGEEFISNDNVVLVLGDNFFYGSKLKDLFKLVLSSNRGASIIGKHVERPERFGVINKKDSGCIEIVEKPKIPESNVALTGIYFFNSLSINFAKELRPSERGELEIVDLINKFQDANKLSYFQLTEKDFWSDMGTPESLLDVSEFVRRKELKNIQLGCVAKASYEMNLISEKRFKTIKEEF